MLQHNLQYLNSSAAVAINKRSMMPDPFSSWPLYFLQLNWKIYPGRYWSLSLEEYVKLAFNYPADEVIKRWFTLIIRQTFSSQLRGSSSSNPVNKWYFPPPTRHNSSQFSLLERQQRRGNLIYNYLRQRFGSNIFARPNRWAMYSHCFLVYQDGWWRGNCDIVQM